jgi:hypothetical protein
LVRRKQQAVSGIRQKIYFIPFGSDTPKLASALCRGSLSSYS